MNLDRETVGDVQVLTLKRSLTGGKETEELLAVADQIAAQGPPRIVIDLRKIDWIGSTGLGALVKVHVSCINREGWLRVAGIGKRIKNVFLVTRLILLFDTFETVDEAIAGLPAGHPRPGDRLEASD
jgi:anti-sigma B factor antagonist